MKSIGIYIHIPFCDGKCSYCNFFSKCADDNSFEEYTNNLIRIIGIWGEKVKREVYTVYFGGGTPSLLGHSRLIKILKAVQDNFTVTENAEITVEVNPSSTDTLSFEEMKAAGFNRLSIGLQSANDNELSVLGRRHSIEDAENTVKRAKESGFDNISLDVMLAIPEQTKDSLNRTLEFCASCKVQHISAYILKIESGTKFDLIKDRLNLFDEDSQTEFYEYAVNKLKELSFEQYEISNFCKKGFESRHNLRYWHDEEYIGIGPSAHSFLNGERFYYNSSFADFYANKTVFESSGGDKEEYIMLALRLSEGLVFEKYEERFSEKLSEKLIKAAKILQDKNLCKETDTSLSLTLNGFLVSNSVIAYLLENL